MKYKPVRIWLKTHRLAKIIAAHLDETLVAFLHRIVIEEAKRQGLKW